MQSGSNSDISLKRCLMVLFVDLPSKPSRKSCTACPSALYTNVLVPSYDFWGLFVKWGSELPPWLIVTMIAAVFLAISTLSFSRSNTTEPWALFWKLGKLLAPKLLPNGLLLRVLLMPLPNAGTCGVVCGCLGGAGLRTSPLRVCMISPK